MSADNIIFCTSLPDAFAKVGMTFPDRALQPGKITRFATNDNPRNTSGWCWIFPDGMGASFGCNRTKSKFIWEYRNSLAPPLSKAERQALSDMREQQRKQADLERISQHVHAAANAVRIFADADEINPANSYVINKGIKPYLARQSKNGSIVLPIHGTDGAIQSLQFIDCKGGKLFLRAAKKQEGRLYLGVPENGKRIFVVEGWATACSIHEAMGEAVATCFDGGNMAPITADLRRQFPDSPLVVAADLDAHGAGLKHGQAAAAAGKPASLVLPVFSDGRDHGDYNDLAQAEGLNAVRQQLSAVPKTSSYDVALSAGPPLLRRDARDGTETTRPLTELGNAHRMFDTNNGRLRYVPEVQSWLVWHNDAWQWDEGSRVRMLAANLPAAIYAEGSQHLTEADFFAKWARKSQEQRTINAVVSILSDFASVRLQLSNIDANHFSVGFNDAQQVIDLRTGSARMTLPSDYITKSLRPKTIGNSEKALRWIQFLKQVFHDDWELIDWIHRFCGYLLTGSTQEQVFLFCFGHGANGKSVFIEVLKHIVGDYSRAIAPETLSESKRQAGSATPDLAALIGARLVLCSETEDNTALAESLVKSLVSGDSMAVRQLYAAPVQFTPNFKLVMAGNHKPIVRGNDNGIWRRVRLVPFNRTFEPAERDPHLLDKLKTEAPHILAWMVQGCIEWQRRGLADVPKVIRQATDAYQVDQDLTGRWLDECTTNTPHGETTSSDLYANYKAWSLDNGLRPASAVALGRRLSERNYRVRQSNGKRFWCGLSLTDSRHNDYIHAKGGY